MDQVVEHEYERAILLDVVELLRRHHVADKALETSELRSWHEAEAATLAFLTRTSAWLRGLPGFPAEMPGVASRRLLAAIHDQAERKVDPKPPGRGRPKLATNDAIDRAPEALAMELLMAKDPLLSPEQAAQEVLDRQRDRRAGALVRRWRRLRAGKDLSAEIFAQNLEETKQQVRARGMTADAYDAVIDTMLGLKK